MPARTIVHKRPTLRPACLLLQAAFKAASLRAHTALPPGLQQALTRSGKQCSKGCKPAGMPAGVHRWRPNASGCRRAPTGVGLGTGASGAGGSPGLHEAHAPTGHEVGNEQRSRPALASVAVHEHARAARAGGRDEGDGSLDVRREVCGQAGAGARL